MAIHKMLSNGIFFFWEYSGVELIDGHTVDGKWWLENVEVHEGPVECLHLGWDEDSRPLFHLTPERVPGPAGTVPLPDTMSSFVPVPWSEDTAARVERGLRPRR
ncbi:MAG: hypothetical protein JWP89_307 [Schlesneria sp.]|nr:hypothetical protein [Schlesneria sp.]